MGPRRKPASSSSSLSKKSNLNNQQLQPSKFGIQHFFERHSQNALASQNPKSATHSRAFDSKTATPPSNNSQKATQLPVPGLPQKNRLSSGANDGISVISTVQKSENQENLPRGHWNNAASKVEIRRNDFNSEANEPKHGVLTDQDQNISLTSKQDDPKNHLHSRAENLQAASTNSKDNPLDVSPEIAKSLSVKRFKFSPGMLIKQSQDEGGDDVTWKISPMNERFQAISKHMPEMVRVLEDDFCHCSKQTSPGSTGKLENWLASPMLKHCEKSLALLNRVSLKRVHTDQGMAIDGGLENAIDHNQQSPFQTPPSLSFCHNKPANAIAPNAAFNQLELRQHKKALIELLDQVEDVICVEESMSNSIGTNSFKVTGDDNMHIKADPMRKTTEIAPEEVNRTSSSVTYLVLEVSEKQTPPDSSNAQCSFKVLRLLNEQSGEERGVHLWDEWFYSVIAPGDTVNVIGQFDDKGKCDVDHDKNLLIVHPDILVSGTRVAASFSCPRRTVLDERLKSSEYSSAALIGTLLHQIFQAGLTRETATKDYLEEYARIVLLRNIESLYACGVNESEMHTTLIEAIPKLLNWIILFRETQNLKSPTVDFGSNDGVKEVLISEVMDVEEMAWAPKYGLKGIIDASVRVKVDKVNEKIMPLEFKTGKGTSGQSAMEHRAQVMLYTILMSERYMKHIDSGLLYYLHTAQTQGISVQRSDLTGLIMRRNELANNLLKASTTQKLPPMLQSPNMCKGCRNLNVCTIYHRAHGGSSESSGLSALFDSHVHHLTAAHCNFLRQWDQLIDLEAKQVQVLKREIWHPSNLNSEQSTSRLSSIVLDPSNCISEQKPSRENIFVYRFVRQDLHHLEGKVASPNDLDCTLRIGDYVILSTQSGNLQVANGVITDISPSHVSVSFSKRLRLPGRSSSSVPQQLGQEIWRIDRDEATTSFAIMRFNLVQLFLQSDKSSHLRKMIVDLQSPRFDSGGIFSQDPAISYIWSEESLNSDQRRAIVKILTAKDYALILGMPGTGKTSTMVHAVKALLMRGASILLTSYTNSAVDNLLIKLKAQGIDFVRIGRYEAVHEEVRNQCFPAMKLQSVEDVKLRLDQVKVVAVTCLGITSPLLANKRFDICIMDEAGQTTLPVSLGPLMFASVFVLVGDHYQLPPLVQSTEARENGMGISLFCRLSEAHPQAISPLQSQYRMCSGIMELSNALIYGNRLRCGSSEIENSKLKLINPDSISPWLKEVLDPDLPVTFINTDMLPAFESKENKTIKNPMEAYIIAKVTEELLRHGIQGEDIGIITPYNSQVDLIQHAVGMSSSVEIHTIDKYQGRDKDCIVVSFVRSSKNPRNCCSSLLGDWHRINVALTRAKKKLIMVGSCMTLSKVPLLKLLIEKVDERWQILTPLKKDIDEVGMLKSCSSTR